MEARLARLEERMRILKGVMSEMRDRADHLEKIVTDLVVSVRTFRTVIGFGLSFGPALGVWLAKLFG